MGFATNTVEHLPGCPLCRSPLRELERVSMTHVPASIPKRAEAGYRVTRQYTVVQCSKGHRMNYEGDHRFSGPAPATHWEWPL
jgi:hypothetical protein